MPLYEYECEACGHRFEVIQKFSDSPVEKCPKCGGRVRKLFASPAIQFKGSGWYITDYARKDSGSKAAGESKDAGTKETTAEKDTSTSESKTSDTKPAATAPKNDA